MSWRKIEAPGLRTLNIPIRASGTYFGSFVTDDVKVGGQAVNPLVRKLMWPWETITGGVGFLMTDVSTYSQQKVLREKVDTVIPPHPAQIRSVNKIITQHLIKLFRSRNLKPRIMTKDEFITNVRNNAAIGSWSRDVPWKEVQDAVHDQSFWNLVGRERHLHLQGKCEMCVYNTMGKKEKKNRGLLEKLRGRVRFGTCG